MKPTLITLCIFLNAGPLASVAAESQLCKNQNKANCLYSNFEYLKNKNPDEFEKLFLEVQKEAIGCKKLSTTAKFIEIGTKIGGSASLQEYFAEAIEKHLLQNPTCLLAAASISNKKSRIKLIEALNSPLLLSRKDVQTAFLKVKPDRKYSKELNEFIKIQHTSEGKN